MIESVTAVPRWKHATQLVDLARPSHIAVFDDERVGVLSLYATDGRRFAPLVQIPSANPRLVERNLMAWSKSRPLLDLRQDKSSPLPGRVENFEFALPIPSHPSVRRSPKP